MKKLELRSLMFSDENMLSSEEKRTANGGASRCTHTCGCMTVDEVVVVGPCEWSCMDDICPQFDGY